MKLIHVGLGAMGVHWVKVIADFDDVEIVAFVDVDVKSARAKARKLGLGDVPVYDTLIEALEHVTPDAILDVSPPHTRVEHIGIAVSRQLPVLMEKPLAPTMAEAYQIRDLVKSSPLPYVVSQDYRYKPYFQTLKQYLPEIGHITSVNVQHYRGLTLPGFHQQLAYPLLQDMSIHHFDLMRFLFGRNPQTITAFSWNPPNSTFPNDSSVAAFLEFPDGLRVNYNASWSSTGFETDWNGNWRIEGEKGALELHDNIIRLQKIVTIDTIERGDYAVTKPQKLELVKTLPSGQHALLDEFYRTLQGKTQAVTTIQDNIQSLAMVFAVIGAIEAGHTFHYHLEE